MKFSLEELDNSSVTFHQKTHPFLLSDLVDVALVSDDIHDRNEPRETRLSYLICDVYQNHVWVNVFQTFVLPLGIEVNRILTSII